MKKKFVIIGLRAMRPWDLLSGSVSPGYLGIATENYRYGFLVANKGWHAWYSDPFTILPTDNEQKVLHFESEQDAKQYATKLLADDNGTFRPLTILPIYL